MGPRARARPFYNPAMAVDRDLGVALVRALAPAPGEGWEMTASTGVRGLRLLHETEAFRSFLFTEADPRSFAVLQTNVQGEVRAQARLADASEPIEGGPFDYVDLDPYGSPLPFVRSALAATRTGGILAVTATDMTVLAGAQRAACRRLYGSEPVRGRLGPEGALRILLMVLAREAAATGRSVRPQLAYVGGHHVRAYVRLTQGSDPAPRVGELVLDRWPGPPLGRSGKVGPMWLGPLADPELVGRMAVPASAERARELGRFLDLLQDDARVPVPFYYEANTLARSLRLPAPPGLSELVRALHDRGYLAGRTHVRPEGFRTDAPRSLVEEIARSAVGSR